VPARLVRELLHDQLASSPRAAAERSRAGDDVRSLRVRAGDGLHEVARSLEVQLYEQLHAEHDGDFAAMARVLLGRDDPRAARKVRLRFNQLGLRVRPSDRS
jgi:hypothetical protein